jgi:hypothetical protein
MGNVRPAADPSRGPFMAHRVVSLLCNDSVGMGGKADLWQAIRADVFMSSRPRRLNSLSRRQRMCRDTNPGSPAMQSPQVDIPHRDADRKVDILGRDAGNESASTWTAPMDGRCSVTCAPRATVFLCWVLRKNHSFRALPCLKCGKGHVE